MKELSKEYINKTAPEEASVPTSEPVATPKPQEVGISDSGLSQKSEVSENSNPSANPSLFNQLVACKESTSQAMTVKPQATKEGIEKLFNFVSQEQETCLKVIEKIEPLAKDSLAPTEFVRALSLTKDRINGEKTIIYITFKDKLDSKNTKDMEKFIGLKLGLDIVKGREEVAWNTYKATLIKEQNRINGISQPFDWTLVVLPVMFLIWYALAKGPAVFARLQKEQAEEDMGVKINEKEEEKKK